MLRAGKVERPRRVRVQKGLYMLNMFFCNGSTHHRGTVVDYSI